MWTSSRAARRGLQITHFCGPISKRANACALTRVSKVSYDAGFVVILTKVLIAVALMGLLRCSERFRSMSRELDEAVFAAIRRIMHATEEYGYPPEFFPILLLLTALTFMLASSAIPPFVR